ncbi:putative E3 ubiquitin-protein ligase [Exophiala dermatitidis]|uniref:HECT-type E3 ubiquitin transferase n=2 Tax=Exophiala dermatitidis TaxID=5970 RepID=H6BSE3_EXODN|nr:other hect domain ubiquitin protein ligase E3 [Exophiala dermatitidis NIH/UT8656]KAJ4519132.1 putative E3 ubiquitin-protein ligase [Exophiala dermatitidis]EHY53349.1 other hect domain ubiquitin protein ligase E3 [Exophiala dermatitidis NIH/UT8656]KAJ4522479.1 putative E3 ubiquitin-protein ligase [Exophiala dermatitidis]KAJ4529803.1 putative E3 ubiquitin-protein ligase [Exophiala dermatitidis]KAJ4543030.1 putative E3 ubiquitin-protein ligase [Exophiala dermatitidis]
MAPTPPAPNHANGRPVPRNIQTGRNTIHDRPTTADLNRPLPPPPVSASAESYEIPSLRRKPVPPSPEPPSTKSNHARSFSHPFPSLFGSKKSDKKNNVRGDGDSNSGSGRRDTRPEESNSKVASAESAAHRGGQFVTGRCITCDSTVRWPHDLKVFRCTTCLTINDLEDNTENRATSSTAGPGVSPPRKLIPLSRERTRALMDRCLRQYLESYITEDEARQHAITFAGNSPEEESFLLAGTPPEGLFYGQSDHDMPAPSPQPKLKARSPSEPTLTPRPPPPRPQPHGADVSFMRGSSAERSSTSAPMRNGSRDLTERDLHGPAIEARTDIFRMVENYISGSFVGCATLNQSFLLPKPPQDQKPRAGSDAHQRRQLSEPTRAPTCDTDVFLSELDAKTLLLGDVAENGSWWLGASNGRAAASRDPYQHRDRSPDKGRGSVTSKNPRINWAELADWYKCIIYAGDQWEQIWRDMKEKSSDAKTQQRWQSAPTEKIQRDILESRGHLQRCLLKATENLLKRPRRPLKHPEDARFLLILLSNPLLTPTRIEPGKVVGRPTDDRYPGSPAKRATSSGRRPGSLGHHSGIIKRILGLMANLPNDVHHCLVSWFARYSDGHFQRTVEMVNSFVTYRLARQQKRPVQAPVNPTEGLVPSFSEPGMHHASQIHAALGGRPSSTSAGKSDGKPKLASYGEDWQIRAAARVMALLFQANVGHSGRRRDGLGSQEQRLLGTGHGLKLTGSSYGQIIPISSFYNTMLDYADLVADFETWETTKSKFTFCQYPFFLSIYAKIHILEHDARRQMEVKAREAFFDSILSRKAVSQFLVLKVRRDCLVEDSLRSVSEVVGSGGSDIKKGLRIDFQGEEGIDAGGIRKEWFLLLVREIFDPNHGLFVYDDDSGYCYFNPYCFESSEQFFLVGVLLGLAIYNSTILDVAFPPFVFKKLLASAPSTGDKLTSTPKVGHGFTLEDLAEFRPALARGFKQLLEFEGDVEETFCRDFVAEMDRYGEIVQVPLCPGGEKRAVTNANRREFVDLYIHYLLETSVARQYEPFKRGFFTVCGGNALSLFRPEEIELLVRGSDEPLDIASLRAVATYDGWPKNEGPPEKQSQVVWFWDFFARVSPEDQRKILSFITGSDRIPAMGATNLNIRIQLIRSKDEFDGLGRPTNKPVERFPIARTCFNTLSLYRYSSREKLEHKLWMAVTGSEGFGLK